MATSMLSVDIAINSLLCFTVSKRNKLSENSLKRIILDYYSIDEVTAAKRRLISDIELFATDDASLPRFPDRSGDKRFEREVNDVFAILSLIDERNIASKLPTYVADNCERIPSVKLDDGDLRFMLAKMDKMAAMIEGLQATMNALFDINRKLSDSLAQRGVINNNNTVLSSVPVAQPTNTVALGSSSAWTHPPASLYQPLSKHGAVTSGVPPSIHNSNVIEKSADLVSSWADAPVASTGDSCNDTDGFQVQESRRKRRRTRTRSNLPRPIDRPGAGPSFSTNEGELSTQLRPQFGRVVQSIKDFDNSKSLNNNRDSGHINSRKPLIVGKSTVSSVGGVNINQKSIIAAARPLKAIFCIDNVSSAYGVHELCEFVASLGVRILSCFEVAPRYSRWQKDQFIRQQRTGEVTTPFRRAFRLCINRADTALLLRADAWPSDITISKWFFVKDSINDKPVDHMGESQIHSHDTTVVGLASADGASQNHTDNLSACNKVDSNAAMQTSNRFEALQTSTISNSSDIEVDAENTVLYVSQDDVSDKPLASGTPFKST